MGTETITKEREVEEEKEVHVCDFCGRDSDEASGFEDVLVDVKQLVKSGWPSRSFNVNKVASDKHNLSSEGLHENLEIDYIIDEEKHLCKECYNAFKGVVDK